MKFPKVLILSNNPLSNENNMGKTLSLLFRSFPVNNLAQLYFHSGLPTTNLCKNYYCFDDSNALKSIVFRWYRGKILENQNFESNITKTFDYGVYEIGKKKRPIIYFARDIIWKFSNFRNKKLLKWVLNFNPDFIFFASGDYSFAYKNALWLSKKTKSKLITMCFDDYYLNCEYKDLFLGKIYFSRYIKIVNRTIDKSYKVIACNDLMSDEYSKYFNKRFNTLYTPCKQDYDEKNILKCGVTYIGGLALKRHLSLSDVGEIVNFINNEKLGTKLNVYSPMPSKDIFDFFNKSQVINYMGKASSKDVSLIINKSFAVVHVESFDERMTRRTRLSLSTKIAESLSSGTLLIAYGPKNIASINYLMNNDCAIVSDNKDELKSKIIDVLNNPERYSQIVKNANNIALINHSYEACLKKLLSILK